MGLSDKALGGLMILTACAVFTYYSIWALVLPFFPSSTPIHGFFPAREWAVWIPVFLLVVGLFGVGSLLGVVTIREARKQKAKAGKQS